MFLRRHSRKIFFFVVIVITGCLLVRPHIQYEIPVPPEPLPTTTTPKPIPTYRMKISKKDPSTVFVDIGGGLMQMGRLQKSINYTRAKEDDPKFMMNSTTCRVEPWNNVHSDQLPYQEYHEYWLRMNISRKNYLYHTTPSPLAAFVHPGHITVTLTAENMFGKIVYCRYFDCKRKEIPHVFESKVFPESTVYCGRRVGAKFVSVTQGRFDIPEIPVRIQNRVDGPQHYLTVCMATIYGPEPKFIQIVDFIEHHKLHGATFFHIYLRNASAYDRMLLDDYVRTGEIELIVLNDHYWRADYMWHMMQINDCHMRSVGFSKWTAILDIDERIEMKRGRRIVEFLDAVKNPDVVNLQFRVEWVLKDTLSPARYESDWQIFENLVFRKFHNTSRAHPWLQPKTIVRPESIAAMNIHNPDAVYQGLIKIYVSKEIGVIRHYRNLEGGSLPRNNQRIYKVGPYSLTDVDPSRKIQLTDACLHRVKQVYDTVTYPCIMMHKMYRHHGMNHTCMEEQLRQNDTSRPL